MVSMERGSVTTGNIFISRSLGIEKSPNLETWQLGMIRVILRESRKVNPNLPLKRHWLFPKAPDSINLLETQENWSENQTIKTTINKQSNKLQTPFIRSKAPRDIVQLWHRFKFNGVNAEMVKWIK